MMLGTICSAAHSLLKDGHLQASHFLEALTVSMLPFTTKRDRATCLCPAASASAILIQPVFANHDSTPRR
jgi:hypothetical protein